MANSGYRCVPTLSRAQTPSFCEAFVRLTRWRWRKSQSIETSRNRCHGLIGGVLDRTKLQCPGMQELDIGPARHGPALPSDVGLHSISDGPRQGTGTCRNPRRDGAPAIENCTHYIGTLGINCTDSSLQGWIESYSKYRI